MKPIKIDGCVFHIATVGKYAPKPSGQITTNCGTILSSAKETRVRSEDPRICPDCKKKDNEAGLGSKTFYYVEKTS